LVIVFSSRYAYDRTKSTNCRTRSTRGRSRGEEWSSAWGGSEAQWLGAIFLRIRAFIPTDTILEIAPGFGRWTNFSEALVRPFDDRVTFSPAPTLRCIGGTRPIHIRVARVPISVKKITVKKIS